MNPLTRGTPATNAYLDLQNQARRTGRPTDELLRLYILEGFLARLAASTVRDRHVLKGGVLLAVFGIRRPTRDVDLAALHLSNDTDRMRDLVRTILTTRPAHEDGITYDTSSLTAASIRDEEHYTGVRITATARLASAALSFGIDINLGDPIVPAPQPIQAPRLRGGRDRPARRTHRRRRTPPSHPATTCHHPARLRRPRPTSVDRLASPQQLRSPT